MSTFGIFIETIAVVRPHPNADRLELAELDGIGYQFVIGKGTYQVGDQVLYFPIDAVLPGTLVDVMGLTGKLSGKAKNRVKTIKLRGEISQGLVGSLSLIPLNDVQIACEHGSLVDGKIDFGPILGVVKYEPPEVQSGGPNTPRINTHPLPVGVGKYDIENCERWKAVVEQLLDVPVLVTEKLEGCHIALTRFADGTMQLCSRNCLLGSFTGTENPDEVVFGAHYYRGAHNAKLADSMAILAARHPDRQITLRGELCGPSVQGNIYGLTKLDVYLFEVELDSRPISSVVAFGLDLPTKFAPVIAGGVTDQTVRTLRSILADRDTRAYSNGASVLRPTQLREGVVIKPLDEISHPKLGRLFLKQRSPEYLAQEV